MTSIVGGPYSADTREFGLRALPFRVDLKQEQDISSKPIRIAEVANRLGFVRDPKRPGVYLQTHLREIDSQDYETISHAIQERVAAIVLAGRADVGR